jgi:hypothetical protein
MHKLQPIVDTVLKQRRSKEDRTKNKNVADQRMIQQYIKNGSDGDLELEGTHLTELPPELTRVGRDLNLITSKIKSLPDNLRIEGSLYLSNAPINTLPDKLVVDGEIYMENTGIFTFPRDIEVALDIYAEDSPIGRKYSSPWQLDLFKAKFPGIMGDIFV